MTHNVIARSIAGICILPLALVAQGTTTTRTDSSARAAKRDTLESVVIRATRTTAAPMAARTELTRDVIRATVAGQDAPIVFAQTPSATVYSEAGGYSGYSYLRLRGIDQTRINITFDGVPLNDPEDEVLYFSNVPSLLGSVGSVQVGRGVGASTFGTSAYAGSINLQSVPLATTPRFADVELSGGSFNTWRATTEGATGVTSNGFAAYGRFTRQGTDGYREHSGNDSWSAYGSTGWFGTRDAIKLSGFAGLSGTRLAYLAASEADLAVDRRVNPLTTQEGDRFHQEMVSLQYTHTLTDHLNATLLTYRNSAGGAYDVSFGPATPPATGLDIANYGLAHVWYGASAVLAWTDGDWQASTGLTATDYHREHWLAMRPTLTDREYTNVGVKRDASAFGKLEWAHGAWRVGADLELRRAAFRYDPDPNAGVGVQELSWSFANPRLSASYALGGGVTLFASAGRTSREPARGDLFAGADDFNSGNAADLLPLTRVQPETLDDYEGGASWQHGATSLTLNAFDMEFRNEIAAIGKLSVTGNPIRKNVPRSYRRGVELDGSTPLVGGTLSGNATAMMARIAVYQDESAGATYYGIEPLMSPRYIANLHWDRPLTPAFSLVLGARAVDRMHLANDGNDALVVPASTVADVALRWHGAATEIRAEVTNLLDANAYAGGYADGTTRYFYPMAARALLVTVRRSWGG